MVEHEPSETEDDNVGNAFGTLVSKRTMDLDLDVSSKDGGGEATAFIIGVVVNTKLTRVEGASCSTKSNDIWGAGYVVEVHGTYTVILLPSMINPAEYVHMRPEFWNRVSVGSKASRIRRIINVGNAPSL